MNLHSFFSKSFCGLVLFFFTTSATAQRVGIGTSSPAEKLDVAGNIKGDTVKPAALKLSPNAGSGKVLTSDAAGNASWQNAGPGSSSVGFGAWGDCATNAAISEYNPVADSSGQAGDRLGTSVSISGNFAIAGAPNDDVGSNPNQGSASIFWFNGTNWVYMQKIIDATGAADDRFGQSVAVSGNYVIIGAHNDDVGANANQGSVSFFQFNGTSWVLMQKITDATGGAGDLFGNSVSISGNYAIVGAPFSGNITQGTASIYQFNGTNWVLMQKITQANAAADDTFGSSVSISGNLAIVGAPDDDIGANSNQGSASIFTFNGTSWTQIRYITDATGAANDYFGSSVCISGNYVIIGAFGDDVGANSNQGSASIYHSQAGWSLMEKITDPNGNAGYNFGIGVSVSGGHAIVSSHYANVGANSAQGKALIYIKLGPFWQKMQTMTDPAGEAYHNFGIAVALDPVTKKFIVSSPGAFNIAGKVIFGKIN